jgi:predicted dithiol-disulfide oxidoreductase (DUF899 family)
MKDHPVVSREDWLVARGELLAKEKELTRLRDELSRQRRALGWVKVEKDYVFDGPQGKRRCRGFSRGEASSSSTTSCSTRAGRKGARAARWADNFNGVVVHLAHRDVTLVTVSKARREQIEAFRKRMGWSFKWVSARQRLRTRLPRLLRRG